MTNPPPVAPVVTDEMVEAALHKWFESEGDEIADLKADSDIWEIYQRDMRAAITAALEASGELERLRAALNDIIAAHKTGRFEPLQAAIEAALAKMEESK